MEFYSSIKKNYNSVICSNTDGPRNCHMSEISDTEKQTSYDIVYMWNLKNRRIQMNLFTKQK